MEDKNELQRVLRPRVKLLNNDTFATTNLCRKQIFSNNQSDLRERKERMNKFNMVSRKNEIYL